LSLLVTVTLLLVLLFATTVLATNVTSPLTNPEFTWNLNVNETLGLPWYTVSQWEIEVCTQGLTSSYGYDPKSNNIVAMSLDTPIYRDTVTILAKKRTYQEQSYYELGWYFQPFQGTYDAEVLLYDNLAHNYTLKTGSPSEAAAFDGYQAFPEPCDPDQYTCPPLNGRLTHAQLRWRFTNNGNAAPWQYLTTLFIEANETTQ